MFELHYGFVEPAHSREMDAVAWMNLRVPGFGFELAPHGSAQVTLEFEANR